MNLEMILAEYDSMFGKNSLEEIEQFLMQKIAEAVEGSRTDIVITLLNEIIGFCRDTTQKEKALQYCEKLLGLIKNVGLEGTVAYATSLLNVANAYRAFGLFEESLTFYRTTEEIFQKYFSQTDFQFAGLYNNWSLLYQEMEQYENAAILLKKALEIVKVYEGAVIEEATTHTNLAATLLQLKSEESYAEAMLHLKKALEIFEADGGRDFHYGAALVTLGDAHAVKDEFDEAAKCYEAGLREIEKHTGINDNYQRVLEKYHDVKRRSGEKLLSEGETDVEYKPAKQGLKNLDRCRAFFEIHGKRMLQEKFPEYVNRIAVGMVGEGSDCFGFDDEISMDHDYGLGFCMWLTEADYTQIGDALQQEYEKLLEAVGLVLESTEPKVDEKTSGQNKMYARDMFLQGRRGVFSINGFYNHLLATALDFESIFRERAESGCEPMWSCSPNKSFAGELSGEVGVGKLSQWESLMENTEEYRLAETVNGAVFQDDLGVFTAVRSRLLGYYPEDIWRKKLAGAMHDFSQYAQSNYPRMMARKDGLTAQICVGKAMNTAMDLVYLLEGEYAPYYKWKRKGLEQIALRKQKNSAAGRVLALLEEIIQIPSQREAWENEQYSAARINTLDKCVVLMEQIAEVVLQELESRDIIELRAKSSNLFLESYIPQVLEKKNRESRQMDLVEKIVALEWQQFDKVKNEGGRADCQDNWGTFSIMRKSQYLAWTEELLESYYRDLQEAEMKGWNLIMEKYARMMESTAPEKYGELEQELPRRSSERLAIQEEIIKIQVGWMEAFAEQYPKMAGNARSIHTSEDSAYNTSYETYLRGEIGTYSEETFVLYGRFVIGLAKEGRNLAYEIMENTAKLYGYESVEDAESQLE